MYNTHRWKKQRALLLRDQPLCVRCANVGVTKLAKIIDHCIPARVCDDFYDIDNLFNICASCHSDITKHYDNKNAHEVFTEDYASIKYSHREFTRAGDGFPIDEELDKILLSLERIKLGVELPPCVQ